MATGGGTPRSLDVEADVSLGPDPSGGFKPTGITLTVSGDVDGLDATGFESAAEAAKVGCPVSKALTGVDITLKVTTYSAVASVTRQRGRRLAHGDEWKGISTSGSFRAHPTQRPRGRTERAAE